MGSRPSILRSIMDDLAAARYRHARPVPLVLLVTPAAWARISIEVEPHLLVRRPAGGDRVFGLPVHVVPGRAEGYRVVPAEDWAVVQRTLPEGWDHYE